MREAPPGTVTAVRGRIAESRHLVHVAVCDRDGRLVARAGDPDRLTTLRSSAKPFQAEPLLASGAADAFGFDDEVLAVICASHAGRPDHVAAVRRGFGLAGLDPALLRNFARGDVEARLRHNCSGNHLGFLAHAAHRGWPLEGYRAAGHPAQQAALEVVAAAAGREPGEVPTCVDGCGVLAFALPLRAIAALYARLDERLPRQHRAMRGHPEMIAGDGYLDTELPRAVAGAASKGGAEGLECICLAGEGVGVAVRVEDGGARASEPAAVAVLSQLLGWSEPPGELARILRPPIVGAGGDTVGELVADVALARG